MTGSAVIDYIQRETPERRQQIRAHVRQALSPIAAADGSVSLAGEAAPASGRA